jgi:hypothetical protein
MNRRFLAVLLAAIAGGGLALGQGPGGGAPAGANGASVPPPNDLPPSAEKVLTPAEMREEGAQIVQRAKDAAANLQRMAARARTSGDVMVIACVAPHLAAVRALAGAAKDRQASMLASFDRGSADGASHNFRMLSVIDDKTADASKEAAECLGDDLYDTADSTTQFTVDPGTPSDDGTTVDGAPDLQIPLPPPKSDPAFVP